MSTPSKSSTGTDDSVLAGSQVGSEQLDTIGLSSTAEVQVAEYVRPSTLADLVSDLRAPEDGNHSIRSFMARPTVVQHFELSAQDEPGHVLVSWDVTSVLFGNPNFRAVREKLQGFYGFSATAVFRLIVNAQPMECGLYWMFFAPFFDQDSANTTFLPITMNTNDKSNSLPFTTGLPGKLMNIAQRSHVELKVPYVGPNIFMNLTDDTPKFGTIMIQCVAPLAAASNGQTCGATLLMSFEDVVIFGATHPWKAQGPPVVPMPSTTEKEEREGHSQGSIADAAKTVSSIPLLDAVAPEVSFGAKAVGAVAAQFGLSKPVADPNISRITFTPFGQPQHVDATSNAFKLGVSETTGTRVAPLGLTEEDEMSILSLVTKRTYLGSLRWSTEQANGAELGWFPVNPNVHKWEDLYYYPSLLQYVSSMFRYWRGSIRFTFVVVATQFHSGRLRFVYDLDSQSRPTQENVNYNFSQIVDIRGPMTFTIECPFFATTPYRLVPNKKDPTLASGWFVTDEDVYANKFRDNALYVFVENALRVNENAAQSIHLEVFVSGGEDYELATPQITNCAPINSRSAANTNSPLYDGSLQSGGANEVEYLFPPPEYHDCGPTCEHPSHEEREVEIGVTTKTPGPPKAGKNGERPTWKPQAIDPSMDDDIPIINMCGSKNLPKEARLSAAEVTVGEKITSLRELVKRYQHVGNGNVSDTNVFMILPFFRPLSYDEAGLKRATPTFLGRVWPLFRFTRGGMRFMLTTTKPTGLANINYLPSLNRGQHFYIELNSQGVHCPGGLLKGEGGEWFLDSFVINRAPSLTIPTLLPIQGGVELQFPYYSRFPMIRNDNHMANLNLSKYTDLVNGGLVPAGFGMVSFVGLGGSAVLDVYQAAADDFTCGYALGAPVCKWNVSYDCRGIFS